MKPAAPARSLLLALLLFGALPAAEAQITLTADDVPYQLGDNDFTQRFTDNEDGSNTAALEALIALDGPNQTYDFSGVTFEELIEGTIEVTSGATGPGAGISPLDQATLTARFPLEFDPGGGGVTADNYFYTRIASDEAVNLGAYIEGEQDGTPFVVILRNLPAGAVESVFPLTFGTTWSDSYTQEADFDGTTVTSTVDSEYEVDGWGTMTGPGFSGVPVLRVRHLQEITTFGFTITTVTYEFRSQTSVFAAITEGDTGVPPTASITVTGPLTTAVEDDGDASGFALAPAQPNPLTAQATLAYRLPTPQHVRLTVHDALGREVAVLVDGTRPAGTHEVAFDARALPNGVYTYRLTAGPHRQARLLTVLR